MSYLYACPLAMSGAYRPPHALMKEKLNSCGLEGALTIHSTMYCQSSVVVIHTPGLTAPDTTSVCQV